MAHKALSAGIAVLVAGSAGGATLIETNPSSFVSIPVSTQACAPRNISNTPSTTHDRSMDVTWNAPDTSCGPVDHYNIVVIDSSGAPSHTVATAPDGAFSASAGNLNRCTYYRFGVQAVYQGVHPAPPTGPGAPAPNSSPVALPSRSVFMAGLADPEPKVVVILLQGITSHDSAGAFNPATQTYCTTPNGTEPPANAQASLQDFDSQWINYHDDGSPTSQARAAGAGNNLIDSLASTGAWVLPFSYNGATLSGTATNPQFTTAEYSAHDVGFDNPTMSAGIFKPGTPQMPPLLQAEVASIHGVLPDAKILLAGHSNGGLIAEQWWLFMGRNNPDGVVQAFSLDSPVNGVFDGSLTFVDYACPGGQECQGTPVSFELGDLYSSMWHDQSNGDPGEVQAQNQSHLYTAVGTYGDPLYDAGDNGVTGLPTTDSRVGIMSQIFFTEPDCQKNFPDPFDLSTGRCQPAGQYFIDPCSQTSQGQPAPLDTGHTTIGPLAYGFPGNADLHSVVKNCPGVIQHIMSYVTQTQTPTSPSPSPSSSPSWACTSATFEQVLANPNETEVSPAGQPRCLDGYAVMNFANPAGQPAPFFFVFSAGKWSLVEGGNAVPTTACTVIPHQVMSAWGYPCTGSATPGPGPATAPGHGSPAAAVAGLLASEVTGDWSAASGACSYVQPDAQSTCAALESGNAAAVGSYQIGATVTQGNEALVEVTGRFSAPGSPTLSNSDPASGMPNSQADFQSVFDQLVNNANSVLSPEPCIEVGGLWYADIGG